VTQRRAQLGYSAEHPATPPCHEQHPRRPATLRRCTPATAFRRCTGVAPGPPALESPPARIVLDDPPVPSLDLDRARDASELVDHRRDLALEPLDRNFLQPVLSRVRPCQIRSPEDVPQLGRRLLHRPASLGEEERDRASLEVRVKPAGVGTSRKPLSQQAARGEPDAIEDLLPDFEPLLDLALPAASPAGNPPVAARAAPLAISPARAAGDHPPRPLGPDRIAPTARIAGNPRGALAREAAHPLLAATVPAPGEPKRPDRQSLRGFRPGIEQTRIERLLDVPDPALREGLPDDDAAAPSPPSDPDQLYRLPLGFGDCRFESAPRDQELPGPTPHRLDGRDCPGRLMTAYFQQWPQTSWTSKTAWWILVSRCAFAGLNKGDEAVSMMLERSFHG
jgi:hypothetical protein